MRSWNSERGMSLVEATIILMVLAILTSVLAPSIGDYVNDARQTKVREDLEALGTSVARLVRDTGLPFPVRTAGAAPSKAYFVRVFQVKAALAASELTGPHPIREGSCRGREGP